MATTAPVRTPTSRNIPAANEEACGKYVFCAGMPRSGSTWQYQVVSHLIEKYRGGVRGGFLERPADFARIAEQTAGRAPWLTLKTHNGYPAYAAALRDGRALAVYSYRDLRDVTFSLMHKMRLSFEEIVGQLQLVQCLNDHAFWTAQPNVLCQRYETIVSDPAACVAEVAAFLGIRLADGEAERLAAAYSLEANRVRAQELARKLRDKGIDLDAADSAVLHDEHSQLHWNHIRAGRVGGWRDEATPEQLAVLAKECGLWLIENGYERDLTWGLPTIHHLCAALEATQRELKAERESHAKALHELMALKQFGSFALTVARQLHRVAGWFPRLSGATKRVLRGVGVGKDPALLAACGEGNLSEAGGRQ
jgi:hypothetical protein